MAATTVAELQIQMAMDVARIRDDIQKIRRHVDQGMSQIEKSAKVAKAAIAGIAAGLTVRAFAGWIQGAIDAADQASKMARQIGVATKDMAGLELAFQQGGFSSDAMRTGMARLNRSLADGSVAFKVMGVATTNADGTLRGVRDVLGDVADKFSGYANTAERTRLAQELFGKSGEALIPVLEGGAAGLARYDEIAKQFGLTIGDDVGNRAEQFNDTVDLMSRGFKGIATQLMAQLLPTFQSLAEVFLTSMTQGGLLKGVADALGVTLKLLATIAIPVVKTFAALGTTFGSAISAIKLALRGEFSEAAKVMSDNQQKMKDIWAGTFDQIGNLWSDSGSAVAATATAISNSMNRTAPSIKEVGEAAKKAASELKKLQEAGAAMIATIADRAAALEREASGAEALAEADKLQLDILTKLRDGKIILTAAQWDEVQALLELIRARSADIELRKRMREQDAEEQRRAIAAIDAVFQETNAIRQQIEATKRETDQIGLNAQSLRRLEIARLNDAKAMLVQRAQAIGIHSDARAEIIAINYQIKAIEDLISAREQQGAALDLVEARDAAREAAEHAAAEWRKASESIAGSITDALMRGFESGKGIVKNVVETIKNMFATLVLRPMVQAIVQPAASMLTSILGIGGGAGQALSGAAGLMNAGSSLANFFGLGTGLQAAAYAASVPGLASFGAGSQAAMLASQTSVFGAQGAAMTAAAGGAGSTATASILSTAASALPWIGIGLAVYSLFSKKGGGPKTGGSFQSEADLARLFTPSDQDALAEAVARTAAQSYVSMMRSLGGTAAALPFAVGFDLDPRGTAQSRTSFMVGESGQITSEAGRTPEEMQAALTLAAQRMLVSAFQQSDLPQAVADVFSSIDVATASAEQIAAAMAAAQAIATLTESLRHLGVPAQLVTTALIEAGGGAERFAQSLSAYVGNFYSESERTQIGLDALREQFEALGIGMPATRAQFRALVETLFASGEEGRNLAAQMVGLAGAFAELVPALDEVGRRIAATADEIDAYWRAVLPQSEYVGMQIERLRGRFAALGVEMPATLAEFRAMVEGMDITTDAGKSLQIGLGLLAGEFTALVDGANGAAAAISQAAATIGANNALASFYGAILPQSEQLTGLLQGLLDSSFAALEVPVPGSADDYIALVESISDPDVRDRLMALSGQWAKLQPTLDGAAGAARDALSAFTALYNARKGLYTQEQLIGQSSTFLASQFAELNIAMPETRAAFAGLLEAAAGSETEQRLDALLPLWLDMIGMQEALAAEAQRAADAQREAARRAAQAAIDEANRMAQRIRDALAGVGEFVESLFTSGTLLGLTPQQQLAAAQDVFGAVMESAKGGDVEAIGRLPEVARDALAAAEAVFAHSDQFLSIRDDILASLLAITGQRIPDTGTAFSTTGKLDSIEHVAIQQRTHTNDLLSSIDRRLARMESTGRISASRDRVMA